MTELLTRTTDIRIPQARERVVASDGLASAVADSLAVLVAPTTGRFQPLAESGVLVAGELVGHVTGGRGRADEVRMPIDASINALLVRPGQLVRRGQGLAWLDRAGQTTA